MAPQQRLERNPEQFNVFDKELAHLPESRECPKLGSHPEVEIMEVSVELIDKRVAFCVYCEVKLQIRLICRFMGASPMVSEFQKRGLERE